MVRILFAVVGTMCLWSVADVAPTQAMPPFEFTPEQPRQYTPARPPNAGTSSSGTRRLCQTVCRKQLTCSGQPTDRASLAPCVGACEQALAVRNPVAAKPWRAAAKCDRKPCGRSYDACVAQKMKEKSPNERKCRTICDKRLRCSGQRSDGDRREDCVQRCVVAWESPRSVDHHFITATHKCLRSTCGLATELCVARKLGGPNTRCAKVCEQRLKCRGKLNRDDFVECMLECFPAIMSPSTKASIEAEARCKGCGRTLDRCIAGKLGGYHPYCHDNCSKRSQCRGPQPPIGTKGLASCRQQCVDTVKLRKGAQFRLIKSVDGCRSKRCGTAFNQCVEARQRPQAIVTRTRIVTPTPTPTSTSIPTPPPQSRCRRLCEWVKACVPNAGGPSCLRRCQRNSGAVAEFRAIENCQRFDCGRAWDKCVVQKLGASSPDVRCLDSCRKRLLCDRRRRGSFVRSLTRCVRECRSEPSYLAAIAKCQSMRCGSRLSSCLASASSRPAPPAPLPKPPTVDPRLERCRQLCVKAKMCGDGPADELCQSRCLNDASARREFKARDRCGRRPCRSYGNCVYKALGVPQSRLACVAACRKDAECKRVKGKSSSMASVVRCAKRCRYSTQKLSAIKACAGAGCGMAYNICIEHKLNPKVEKIPVVEVPKFSKKEQACQTLCEKAESCVHTSGGDTCVERCVKNRGIAEFRARAACSKKRCDQYEICVVRRLGLGGAALGCVRACRHTLTCERSTGVKRDLRALMACSRKCDFSSKEIKAIEACDPLGSVGCGPQFRKCFMKKSGKEVELNRLTKTCESLCKKADQCQSGHGGDACMQACQEKQASSREFQARKQCKAKSCGDYPNCLLKRMGVVDGTAHRCHNVCRFELQCDRLKRPGDLDSLAACTKRCTYSDKSLSVREDCQVEGCGSMYKACVKKPLR